MKFYDAQIDGMTEAEIRNYERSKKSYEGMNNKEERIMANKINEEFSGAKIFTELAKNAAIRLQVLSELFSDASNLPKNVDNGFINHEAARLECVLSSQADTICQLLSLAENRD